MVPRNKCRLVARERNLETRRTIRTTCTTRNQQTKPPQNQRSASGQHSQYKRIQLPAGAIAVCTRPGPSAPATTTTTTTTATSAPNDTRPEKEGTKKLSPLPLTCSRNLSHKVRRSSRSASQRRGSGPPCPCPMPIWTSPRIPPPAACRHAPPLQQKTATTAVPTLFAPVSTATVRGGGWRTTPRLCPSPCPHRCRRCFCCRSARAGVVKLGGRYRQRWRAGRSAGPVRGGPGSSPGGEGRVGDGGGWGAGWGGGGGGTLLFLA